VDGIIQTLCVLYVAGGFLLLVLFNNVPLCVLSAVAESVSRPTITTHAIASTTMPRQSQDSAHCGRYEDMMEVVASRKCGGGAVLFLYGMRLR